MCGIAGILGLTGQGATANDRALVVRMVERLRHRGPDSQGIHVEGEWVVGACRLRILGLESASDQPLRSPDSECTIVFNGEIYNYVELREELRRKGHVFVSSGDTEVVVHAYEEWGPECLSRFNGMFALAILDVPRERVFLARDRFGVKPLHFTIVEGRLVFASEIGAILETGLVDPTLDRHTVLDYLTFGITNHSEGTFFASVRQLPAGHFGVVQNGQVTTAPWYKLEAAEESTHADEEGASTARFLALLESSVRLRMRSDVPVGVLLSGGLDSSAILAVSAKTLSQRNIKAFSVSFPGSPLDETRFAKIVATACSVEHEVELAETLKTDDLLECVRHQGEPVTSPSVLAQWLVMKAAHRHGMRVLLSGQGSDEYLAGYEYFDAFAILSAAAHGHLGTALRHLLNERTAPRLPIILSEIAYLLFPPEVRSWALQRTWLRARHAIDPGCPYHARVTAIQSLRAALQFHLEMRISELLRYEDRNSMAFSIETRHPFLDYRLVENALQLPESFIVSAGFRKRILRCSVADIVPREILDRRDKIGFQTPREWLESREVVRLYRDLLSAAPVELRNILDLQKADSECTRKPSRRRMNDFWRILNLLLWYREVVMPAKVLRVASGANSYPAESPIQVIVPSTADWTVPGSGGGMEAFTRTFAAACPPGMMDVTVFCAGSIPQRTSSVRTYPIARQISSERRYVRTLRSLVAGGGLPIPENSVVLANAEHYVLPFMRTTMPVVLVSHGVVSETLRRRKSSLYMRMYRRFVERPAVYRADRIVAINPEVEAYYRSAYPNLPKDKIVRIPVGIDLRDFEGRPRGSPLERFGLSQAVPVVLFVGRLSPEKNADLVVRACDLLTAWSTPVKLVVVGDGVEASKMQEFATSRPWLHWVRHADHEDVLDLMAVANALAICSSYESGPLVLLEAIASSLPVVSTPVGRVRELLSPDLGRVCPPDPEAFARGLLEVLEWDRHRLLQSAQAALSMIDFRVSFDALSRILRDVARRGA